MPASFPRAPRSRVWTELGSRNWAAIPLRLIVGYGFMAHGFAKLARGPEHFVDILRAIGVPAPGLMGWVTILIELVGGFAVLIGGFVAFLASPWPRFCS